MDKNIYEKITKCHRLKTMNQHPENGCIEGECDWCKNKFEHIKKLNINVHDLNCEKDEYCESLKEIASIVNFIFEKTTVNENHQKIVSYVNDHIKELKLEIKKSKESSEWFKNRTIEWRDKAMWYKNE